MSRVGKSPVGIPSGVEVKVDGGLLFIKGAKGQLEHSVHSLVETRIDGNTIHFSPKNESKEANALSGTTRSIANNMVVGVNQGFEKKLTLVGVGYRAQSKKDNITLSLGFSHPVEFKSPDGVSVETPSQTEIVIKGCDKQKVGQVAANIRSLRPPEPYKGKGVRYADEYVARKEAKKK
ncbi:MAG: 50S ribosomal protein L6 [Methylococcales bacterium]